jgi:guanylate kinase
LSEHAPILFVLSAPSGTGKSSLVGRLLGAIEGLRFSVSHNTRPARPGEREGVDYHFVDRAAFEALVAEGAFLEWADVHGDLKGTARAELERARIEGVDLLLDLDVQGAAQVRARCPEAVTVFLLPPSAQEMERRLRGRGQDSPEAIARRLADARREVECWEQFDFLVVNDDLETALAAVAAVVRAERQRRERMSACARRVTATFAVPHEEECR